MSRGKAGGRTAGVPNRVTADVRNMVKSIIEENMGQLQQDIASLSPKDRVMVMEKLLQYVIPKIQAVEFDATKEVRTAVTLLKGMARYSDNSEPIE